MGDINNNQNMYVSEDFDNLPSGVEEQSSRVQMWIIILVAIIVIGLVIAGAIFLLKSEPGVTSQIRDVFIIFMALESLVIGAALIILIIQIAILTNLLQNEIKPILDNTNDTVNTVKGTVTFLSDNVTEPVIKLNEYLAAFKKFFDIIRPKK